MKNSTDHTLFTWVDEDAPDDLEYDMLAPAPRCFAQTRLLMPYPDWDKPTPYSMTNEGLSIELPIQGTDVGEDVALGIVEASLNCPPTDYEESCFVAVYRRATGVHPSRRGERFARVRAGKLGRIRMGTKSVEDDRPPTKHIYVRPSPETTLVEVDAVFPKHFIRLWKAPTSGYRVAEMNSYLTKQGTRSIPTRSWGSRRFPVDIMVRRGAKQVSLGILFVRQNDGQRLLVGIGCLDAARLGFWAAEMDGRSGGKGTDPMPPSQVLHDAFYPTPLGQTMELHNHIVTVKAKTEISGIAKFYLLEVEVEPKWTGKNLHRALEAASLDTVEGSSRPVEDRTRRAGGSSSQRTVGEGSTRWRRRRLFAGS